MMFICSLVVYLVETFTEQWRMTETPEKLNSLDAQSYLFAKWGQKPQHWIARVGQGSSTTENQGAVSKRRGKILLVRPKQ